MKTLKNIFYLALPLFLGGVAFFITRNSIDYGSLIQPPLAPPGFLFPIIWTILYILMGISYFLFKKNSYDNKLESIVYYLQLFVNFSWSIIFFTFKLRFLSIIWILVLAILVYTLITLFLQKYKLSGYLLIPYLVWCVFASYLNIGVYLLN